MPITIQRGAAIFSCTIDLMGHRTTIDLSQMTKGARVELVRSLMEWKANDYKGYPILER